MAYLIGQDYGSLGSSTVQFVTEARFGRNCCLLHHCSEIQKNPVPNFSFQYLNMQDVNLYTKNSNPTVPFHGISRKLPNGFRLN
jgi:hypothetical protein